MCCSFKASSQKDSVIKKQDTLCAIPKQQVINALIVADSLEAVKSQLDFYKTNDSLLQQSLKNQIGLTALATKKVNTYVQMLNEADGRNNILIQQRNDSDKALKVSKLKTTISQILLLLVTGAFISKSL